MNKNYFLLTILGCMSFFTFTNAQVFHNEDFNALTVGNVGTVFDFSAAGQGGFFTFADNGDMGSTTNNAGNANFQIVSSGFMSSNGLQIVGPNGSDGFRQIQQPPFDWSMRTSGNEIIEAEFFFFTGPATTSRNPFRFLLSSNDGAMPTPTRRTMVGVEYDPATGELSGLATLNNNGMEGFFGLGLGASAQMPLTVPANTWVHMGMSYNTTTGALAWKSDLNNLDAGFSNAANVITGQTPNAFLMSTFDGSVTGPPAINNAAAHTIIVDNIEVRATATDQLLNTIDAGEKNEVSIYPNPVNNVLNVSSTLTAITNVRVMDMQGRVLINKVVENDSDRVDVSNLPAQMYLIEVTTPEGSTTKKFVKN